MVIITITLLSDFGRPFFLPHSRTGQHVNHVNPRHGQIDKVIKGSARHGSFQELIVLLVKRPEEDQSYVLLQQVSDCIIVIPSVAGFLSQDPLYACVVGSVAFPRTTSAEEKSLRKSTNIVLPTRSACMGCARTRADAHHLFPIGCNSCKGQPRSAS